jgi:hypothetical protein
MQKTIELKSERLQVEISEPGSIYQGTRFDWTGFITQVTLDGVHTFCVPESLEPGKGCGGIGLCNEFGIDQPVGFQEAKPGDLFPKLGIGLLRKPDNEDYSFGRNYEIAQRFPIQVENNSIQAKFICQPVDCNGYSAQLIKTVRVWGTNLEILYELENTGQKTLSTNEYVHNFVGINQEPIEPDYRLQFPAPIHIDEKACVSLENLNIQGSTVYFRGPLPSLYLRTQDFFFSSLPQWKLILQSQKIGLQEIDDFKPCRVAVWGTFHVLSPEIFVEIALPPGQSQKWTRHFKFFQEGPNN